MSNSQDSGGVQSVDRAISVLELLAWRGPSRVTEVADELGVHKSTAFRLLSALESRGLVEQDGDRGRYQLGFGIVRLAGAVTARMDLGRCARPVCERLATTLGETINDPEATLPGQELDQREEAHGLRQAIGMLPEKERTVLAMYYYEELNLRQIAEVLHVTESRVSQIRTKALGRLRERLILQAD